MTDKIKPELLLERLLPDGMSVLSLFGRTYDLAEQVRIPADADFEELLYEHPERAAVWERLTARCHHEVRRAEDELTEQQAKYLTAVWANLEEQERAEMRGTLHDEHELASDPPSDPFQGKRKARAAARVANGMTTARWHRNFSDALVQAYVNRAEPVVAARKALRIARRDLEVARAVVDAMGHRSRCLSHLAALHRDNSRQ